MGNDGGTIVGRMCVKIKKPKKSPKNVSFGETELDKWRHCSLSQEPLKNPIVIDRLGFLINKEALIKHLLQKSLHEKFSHIRSLKDVYPAKITFSKKSISSGSEIKAFYCPISDIMANGKQNFIVVKPCAHVFSEKALKEVKWQI
ncbi:hypothetical protein MHBO_000928 [Bonamia ostreae]|uniref:Replication termination factor 2 n=1 Tax=Bonamia ostreae TaxID=126728 RepID=A0ABV2AHA1_9EUKA